MENNQYDDKYLLLEISRGDEKSFNLFFERYRNRLFTYLFKITKSRETAEEIVLDVFLKLWHGREVIVEIENPKAFLFRVAHNKAIDFFRAAKRSPHLQQEIWDEMMDIASSESADCKISYIDTETVIDNAISQLTPQRQKVFVLRHALGMSYDQIAQRLNLSPNTVRNHLAASVQFLREILSQNDTLLFCLLFFLLKKNIF